MVDLDQIISRELVEFFEELVGSGERVGDVIGGDGVVLELAEVKEGRGGCVREGLNCGDVGEGGGRVEVGEGVGGVGETLDFGEGKVGWGEKGGVEGRDEGGGGGD